MRRRRYSAKKEAPELDITAFLNLMVVLVPFLLVSAVFSRVTILELNMPSGAGGGAPDDPSVTVEVVVRQDQIEIGDGEKIIARFPNLVTAEELEGKGDQAVVGGTEVATEGAQQMVIPTEERYDLQKLRTFLLQVKGSYPDKTDAIILMEANVAYEYLVGIMDAVREAEVRSEDSNPEETGSVERVVLFPDISLGDAP
ncbi:ExbD/TolR family protein [Biformimicrobium ophioploci]|uniref:Biopolymer transporter ExbD n=1 Tax=Biformimicrobium ophioploci TaxID=3036711 RepID=A0ABQ6LWK1_9GAMM|nr:biopolymer transporter ExbD [Microbulbifer sp. NKW57]GMG86397.1 hypothetical protein MNKW57_07180 [Microbulbifer sp. NKW57]